MRALWIGLGTLFVAIGALGVVLPLLPHTIFFLLAAACYARGSERAHTWLMTNRLFGRYLRDYSERRGATPGTKAVTISMLWIGLALSAWLLAPSPVWLNAILAAVGVGVTTYVLCLNTLRDLPWRFATPSSSRPRCLPRRLTTPLP
ncbi:MAG: DUF454 domain-containing protein [Dehalococcoidia bacterium]|nr:DUF454 domain-containing protein [Dehalococcoidia bacterium]